MRIYLKESNLEEWTKKNDFSFVNISINILFKLY